MIHLLLEALSKLINVLSILIFIRVALTWFPNIQWWKQPFKLLDEITDPVLATFRKFIPPIGGMDLSPIVCFLFLDFVRNFIGQI